SRSVSFPAHDHAPKRQLVHGPDGQPPAPIEEAALRVRHLLPHARPVFEDATVQGDILAAGYDLKRIELQILHSAYRLIDAGRTAPAPSRPQPLFSKDKTTRRLEVDRYHEYALLHSLNQPGPFAR